MKITIRIKVTIRTPNVKITGIVARGAGVISAVALILLLRDDVISLVVFLIALLTLAILFITNEFICCKPLAKLDA
jgi:hypothetical protein